MKHFIYQRPACPGVFRPANTSIALPNEIVQEGLLTTRNGQRMEGVHHQSVFYTG